jgi:hypothetical protein
VSHPLSSMTIRRKRFALLVALSLLPAVARAEDAGSKGEAAESQIETEHIFGFTEGTDIGEKGEREIESTTATSFGKIGNYANVSNETAFRYTLTDRLRLSVGALTDFYSIHGVPDLTDRTSLGFGGLDAEARFVVVDRHTAAFGMDVGITPQWQRLDDVSGANTEGYAVPMVLAIDKELVADKLYGAVNMTYTPSMARLEGTWQHQDTTEVSAAISGVVAPNILLGAEIRHLSLAENGTFLSQALFAGPSFYAKLSNHMEAKIAWSAQVTDFTRHSPDLTNFERQQVILLISYAF